MDLFTHWLYLLSIDLYSCTSVSGPGRPLARDLLLCPSTNTQIVTKVQQLDLSLFLLCSLSDTIGVLSTSELGASGRSRLGFDGWFNFELSLVAKEPVFVK